MNKIILAVDDDPEILNLIVTRFEALGYQVLTAANGPAALDSLRDKTPDIIVADICMPGMNGWQFSQIVMDKNPDKKTPIIFLSAMIQTDGISDDDQPGDYLMAKPFDGAKLANVIESYLDEEEKSSKEDD